MQSLQSTPFVATDSCISHVYPLLRILVFFQTHRGEQHHPGNLATTVAGVGGSSDVQPYSLLVQALQVLAHQEHIQVVDFWDASC